MSKLCASISWLLLVGMVGWLSVLHVQESRADRRQALDLSERLANALRSSERRVELSAKQIAAQLRDVKGSLQAELAAIRNLRERGTPVTPEVDDRSEDAVYFDSEPEPETPALPPLPPGIVPEHFLKEEASNLRAIVEDRRFNPSGKELSRIRKLRMSAEVTRAHALMEILDADIRVAIAEGVEELRSLREFIEYAPGEPYQQAPGVLTAGEQTATGVRMFYLYPEEFPEIYAKKEERKVVADTAVRRILWELQSEPTSGE